MQFPLIACNKIIQGSLYRVVELNLGGPQIGDPIIRIGNTDIIISTRLPFFLEVNPIIFSQ